MMQLLTKLPRVKITLTLLLTVIAASAFSNEFIVEDQDFLALTNATLIDGTGNPVQGQKTLLISGAKIADILESDEQIPEQYKHIDLLGKTVTPGFVMLHEHLFYPTGLGNYSDMVHSFPRLYLAGGTTSIRTAGTMAPYADLNLNRMINKGKILGPDIDVTAPYLNGPGLPILKVKALELVTFTIVDHVFLKVLILAASYGKVSHKNASSYLNKALSVMLYKQYFSAQV